MDFEEKDDLILPEGFEEGQDIFAEEDEAPTTEQPDEADEIDEAEETEEAEEEAPTTEQETEESKPKAKIKVKFNHEERELDEDEAARLAQMGLNYEKVANKAKDL